MPCRPIAGVIGGAFTRAAGRSLLAALLIAPWVAAAAPAEVSLQEAIRRATQHTPLLEARRAAVEAALAPVEADHGPGLHRVVTFAALPGVLGPHPPPDTPAPATPATPANYPLKGGTP